MNPEVDHPRWSQASERRIGEFSKRKTLMFNGYAEQVAGLYRDMDFAEVLMAARDWRVWALKVAVAVPCCRRVSLCWRLPQAVNPVEF